MDDSTRKVWRVMRAQSGDREALDEVLREAQEPLFRFLMRLTGNEDLAKDILQDTFFRICRKLSGLDEPELFLSWAFRIAAREAFRHLKRERARAHAEPEFLESIPQDQEEPSLHKDWIEHLPQWMESVSPASRAVLVLHYFHEMPLREVGDVLGVNLGTVKSRLSYGLRILSKKAKAAQASASA